MIAWKRLASDIDRRFTGFILRVRIGAVLDKVRGEILELFLRDNVQDRLPERIHYFRIRSTIEKCVDNSNSPTFDCKKERCSPIIVTGLDIGFVV